MEQKSLEQLKAVFSPFPNRKFPNDELPKSLTKIEALKLLNGGVSPKRKKRNQSKNSKDTKSIWTTESMEYGISIQQNGKVDFKALVIPNQLRLSRKDVYRRQKRLENKMLQPKK